MILSNQIKCLKCKDIIYSAHRHNFKWCKCESIAIDGGMGYLRRSGEGYQDMSIVIDDDLAKIFMSEIDIAVDRGCNSLGILSAVFRCARDNNLEFKQVDDG